MSEVAVKTSLHMHGRLETLRCEQSGRSEVRMEEADLGNDFLQCRCCETGATTSPRQSFGSGKRRCR